MESPSKPSGDMTGGLEKSILYCLSLKGKNCIAEIREKHKVKKNKQVINFFFICRNSFRFFF